MRKIDGARLQKAITERGYNQTSFAATTGISRSMINQLCKNRYNRDVYPYTMDKMCTVLRVTEEFLSGESAYGSEHEKRRQDFERRKQYFKVLDKMLVEMGIVEHGDNSPGVILNGKDEFSWTDLSSGEYSLLRELLWKRIKGFCDDYVEIIGSRESD